MEFNIGDRVRISDSTGCFGYGTITDAQMDHGNFGMLYKIEYDETGYDWMYDFEIDYKL